jgi:hypothetical protein
MKFKPVAHGDGSPHGVRWDCPGCEEPHVVPTVGPNAWTFNGDASSPTLTPSVVVHRCVTGRVDAGQVMRMAPNCHCFIREGRIEFLGDCAHALAGQTVELPEIEAAP